MHVNQTTLSNLSELFKAKKKNPIPESICFHVCKLDLWGKRAKSLQCFMKTKSALRCILSQVYFDFYVLKAIQAMNYFLINQSV